MHQNIFRQNLLQLLSKEGCSSHLNVEKKKSSAFRSVVSPTHVYLGILQVLNAPWIKCVLKLTTPFG